jgi:spermidine synthase
MANLPAFFMGFLAASFQIYLLREFSVQFYGNELTYGLVLASWFLWGGLGSLLASRLRAWPAGLDRVYYGLVLIFPVSLAMLRLSRFAFGIHPGEITGLGPAMLAALAVCVFTGLPLGALFVMNAKAPGAGVARVYAFESLGAACAGLVVDLALVPLVSNWTGAALVGGGVAAGVFFTFGRRGRPAWLAAALAGLFLFAVADGPSQTAWWGRLHLIRSEDTPYGKLQLVGGSGQVSLYSNGSPVFTSPDPVAAENSVHFAMLQNPGAENILLLGGGAGGGLSEVLKYGRARPDYVEIDPGIVRISRDGLPERERRALADPRVRVLVGDGRRYLRTTAKTYEAILLDLPEPSTAQINRFYTIEFFQTAKSRLAAGGVFSFVVPSSENYIGPDLGRFLASIHRTLRAVFPEVAIVPGDTNVFLASSFPLVVDPAVLEERIRRHGLDLLSINSVSLGSRLSPFRVDRLMEAIRKAPAAINRDLVPAAYYFHSVLWSSQFRGFEAKILRGLAETGRTKLFGFPLLGYVLILAAMAALVRNPAVRWTVPVWAMGFTTIVVEVALIIAFQSFFGYLYGKISLLIAFFMAGMFAGSRFGVRKTGGGPAALIAVQAGFILAVALIRIGLGGRTPEPLFYVFLFALGSLGGRLFTTANRLLAAGQGARPGWAYAADLLGSFAGALTAAAVFIPLGGIPPLLDAVIGMNAAGLLYVFATASRYKTT